jgi:hypothetical protein
MPQRSNCVANIGHHDDPAKCTILTEPSLRGTDPGQSAHQFRLGRPASDTGQCFGWDLPQSLWRPPARAPPVVPSRQIERRADGEGRRRSKKPRRDATWAARASEFRNWLAAATSNDGKPLDEAARAGHITDQIRMLDNELDRASPNQLSTDPRPPDDANVVPEICGNACAASSLYRRITWDC